jgi:nucleoside-diphosphate-sugar epimerase
MMSSGPLPSVADRILLTGATSFPGRRLVQRLLEQGMEVHVIVRPTSDRSRLAGLSGTPVFHEHDGSTENMLDIVAAAAPATVFHLATNYLRDHRPDQISDLVRDNILFGTQLLEAMHAANARHLINLGSFFQYHDSTSYCPTNLYAATKQALEDIIGFYREAHGLQATTLILYDVYGHGDWRPKLMNVIRDAVASGEPLNLVPEDTLLDLVHVEDVVSALLQAASQQTSGGPWAVRSRERVTVRQVVDAFIKLSGTDLQANYGVYPVPARTPTPPWSGPSLPGWQPEIDLEQGVRLLLNGGSQDAD